MAETPLRSTRSPALNLVASCTVSDGSEGAVESSVVGLLLHPIKAVPTPNAKIEAKRVTRLMVSTP
ncbi:MAG: hypothetical protein ACRELY_12645, partial [Polyangiaceae bacterium]